MAPRLSRASVGPIRNFYESSFRQLSDIQQRQVGLVLGAAIGDAAARPHLGLSSEVLRAHTTGSGSHLAFTRLCDDSSSPALATGTVADPLSSSSSPLLQAHSFSYALFAESVRVMASAGGDFDLAHVQARWVTAAGAAPASVFAAHHGRLFHTLLAVLPFPVLYPYASDEALRAHAAPFVSFLTSAAGGVPTVARPEVRDGCFSTLSVVLRYLQSNPDAIRNAAFMSVPGTSLLFPEDVRGNCPTRAEPTLDALCTADAGHRHEDDALERPQWLSEDVAAVRESLIIARSSKTFTEGVGRAILVGAPYGSQCAMLVGGLLGARFGARKLPMDWLNAMEDHRALATLAIEIAQQTWNPAHH